MTLKEVQDGWHGGGVFGKLFALAEPEDDCFEPVVVEQGAAQNAFFGRLDFFHKIEEHGEVSHALPLFPIC